MNRSTRLLEATLIALTLLVAPVGGQQDNAAPTTGQMSKSSLRKVYEEDQENRSVADRAKCRELVRQLISAGKVQSGEDYYYEGFIFQHGQEPSDYLYAHVLAVTAVDKGLHGAIWLSAATLDRCLRSIKQPQIFGTQVGSLDAGPTTQEPYDKEMVSDSLRAMWCVAPYATQAKVVNDVRAGKEFHSTRICPLPEAELDKKRIFALK